MNLNPAKIFIAGIVFTATPSVPKPSSLVLNQSSACLCSPLR